MQKCVNLVDLETCCKKIFHLQKPVSIQPRTCPPNFGKFKISIYFLPFKVAPFRGTRSTRLLPASRNDEGSGNCYAKAFHTEGPDIADQVLEKVRKEAQNISLHSCVAAQLHLLMQLAVADCKILRCTRSVHVISCNTSY